MAEEENPAEGAEGGGGEEEAVKKKEGGGGAAPASNQKFIMIVLMLNTVVLIVVAVLAVISIKKQSAEVSLADVAAGAKDEHAAAEGGDGHGGGGHGGEAKKEENAENNFIKESFMVNLADSRGAHFAQVVIEIEVPDEAVKSAVEALRPKIRDFIVVVLSSKTYEQVSSVDGREFLREEIRNKINGHLTRGQIKEVHFTQFIVQ